MSKKHPIQIRYRFEKAPRPCHSEFVQLAQVAHQLVQVMPWAVPNLPFGTTSRVSGGLLEALPPVLSPAQVSTERRQEPLRLKAIELPDGTFLEHSYDVAGRLVETLYPDNVRVRYNWNDNNQLRAVHLENGKSITYKYYENSLLDSVKYTDGSQFYYQYDSDRNLLRRIYPDHAKVGRLTTGLSYPRPWALHILSQRAPKRPSGASYGRGHGPGLGI